MSDNKIKNTQKKILKKRILLLYITIVLIFFAIFFYFTKYSNYLIVDNLYNKIVYNYYNNNGKTEKEFLEKIGKNKKIKINKKNIRCKNTGYNINNQGGKKLIKLCLNNTGEQIIISNKDKTLSMKNIILIFLFSGFIFFIRYISDYMFFYFKNIKTIKSDVMKYSINKKHNNLIENLRNEDNVNENSYEDELKEIYFLLKSDIRQYNRSIFYSKNIMYNLINSFNKRRHTEEGEKALLLYKSLEREYFLKNKQILKLIGSEIGLLSSKHFTSGLQLLLFILVSTIIYTYLLGVITKNPDIYYNSYETVAMLSNLGGNIEFKTKLGYLYGIYIQIIGVILFGLLIGIFNYKIRIKNIGN